MAEQIAIREPQTVQLSNEQLQYIANTEFMPPGLRGNMPAILACVATGRAIGIPDMTALRCINMIDGRPSFSAELMVQRVRAAGHSMVGEVSEGEATVTGTRIDNGDEMTVTWTLAMAERAGLLSKQNWRKYPEAMLWARAASQLCRMLFADCFSGATYTPEELEDGAGEPQAGSGVHERQEAREPSVSQEAQAEPASPALATDALPAGWKNAEEQKKWLSKLHFLVGTMRDKAYVTTEQIYRLCGRDVGDHRDSYTSEDSELHWSPLSKVLTKSEAGSLIEHLERIEETNTLGVELLSSLPLDAREQGREAIVRNREGHAGHPEAHLAWLREQVARAKEAS